MASRRLAVVRGGVRAAPIGDRRPGRWFGESRCPVITPEGSLPGAGAPVGQSALYFMAM